MASVARGTDGPDIGGDMGAIYRACTCGGSAHRIGKAMEFGVLAVGQRESLRQFGMHLHQSLAFVADPGAVPASGCRTQGLQVELRQDHHGARVLVPLLPIPGNAVADQSTQQQQENRSQELARHARL